MLALGGLGNATVVLGQSARGLAPPAAIARMPGDGTGAFATGKYRDLFAEEGKPAAEIRARIDTAFNQLFHGNPQYERVYFEAGKNANGPLGFMTDWANNDARTEGMSYGMMIAVQMNKKREFDALWNWSNTYMLITDPANPEVGYFAWSMATDGSPRSTGPAPDGEEYYAMALLFAANRWGNGAGIYNYQAQAEKILRGMRHHAAATGTGPFRIHPGDEPFVYGAKEMTSPNRTEQQQAETDVAMETPGSEPKPDGRRPHAGGAYQASSGPMVDEAYNMIRFVPTSSGGFTDASYHLPAFYELFARWGPKEDREFWAKAADVSRDFFGRVTDPKTGLSPDRSNYDGSQMMERDGKPVAASYDSWRTVSNWSVDYSWWHKDANEAVLSERIQEFLARQGVSRFSDIYTLDGKPMSSRHSTGMVATNAVGGLAAARGTNERAFVEEFWRTPVPVGEQRYFDGMLYLMSMLHMSGQFRIWAPAGTGQ